MLILSAILSILVYGIVAATWGNLAAFLGNPGHPPGFSDAQLGTIATAQALGLVVASISVGPLIDIKGKKSSLLLGLTLVSLSLAALPSLENDFTLVLTCLAVLGLGGGIIVTGAMALASNVSQTRRASVLNLVNLFFGLGGLLTPLITVHLLGDNAGAMCYVAAVLGVIALAVNASTAMPRPTGERGFKASEIGVVLGRPALYLLALFLFLYVACEVGVWNWLVKYLIDVRKMDSGSARNILSLGFALGMLVGRVVVSRILVNISALSVTLGAAVAMAATTFWMLQSESPAAAWVAVFCVGLAMAPMFPTTLAIVGDAFPRMTATAMGLVITCGWIGLAVSSPVIGNVAQSSSLQTALLLLPAFSMAMIVVNLAVRPMLAKKG